MLDENLPAFFYRRSSNPLLTILYFTQSGSEPIGEYSIQKINPDLPQSKNKYAVALGDAAIQDVIFGEVLIEPEFQQPTLSAAEVRQQNGVPPPPVPLIPDGFTIQLYNPDQQVAVKGEKSTWTGKESWDFEMPQQSFRIPSASKLDRQMSDPGVNSLTPKITFKWKRDSKFSKDMTCYMTGTSVDGRKNKDPDITIAMYKHAKEPSLTMYEPNLKRVEIEDRKGLEVVLLLGAEVIREIYLSVSRDSFNIAGAAPSRRKNSRPTPAASTSPAHMMTSAIGNAPPARTTTSPITQQPTPPRDTAVDVETKRLQALVQQEEREREKRDRAEQKRIKKMLEDEERERQRRDAEVAKETERLRKQFGLAGQDFGPKPSLPPRHGTNSQQLHPPAMPPRPLSAEPRPHGGFGGWFHGMGSSSGAPPQGQGGYGYGQPSAGSSTGRRRGGSADNGTGKVQKKKSTFF
ncbi:hypothetical protein F4821DRAFT_174498 [Hypoxylon rubiginosum]|uniref:Uncharacterized protein n=1 Tax=Hypoxylon rubiginosum TaxID=110542 RepID=A0ACC0DHB8_9PEZI|nr:hypothetical protein F4821DRAFT_174498 [Hypoxylon rubiginosum]